MKHALLIAFVATFISFNSFAHSFNGNWYFIKGEYVQPDGEVLTADNSSLVAVKSIKDDIFSFTNTENGVFLGYLAGKFEVDGDYYVEAIKEGTRAEHHGKRYKFKGWIETKQEHGVNVDYWHHVGEVNGVKETEVWRRIH